jgi:hypothetical protein
MNEIKINATYVAATLEVLNQFIPTESWFTSVF